MTVRAFVRLAPLVSLAFVTGLATAGDAATAVARAGDSVITVGQVERRLASMPPGQLASLGGNLASAPRRLVEQILVPEMQAELEAKARGLEQSPRVLDRTREILRQAMDAALKAEAHGEKPVTAQEVAAYFAENRSRFEQPKRVRIWRILVDDEALAKTIIADVKAKGEPTKWSELTRQHSIDKATNMRQGDLGFVRPDGSTDAVRVRVDPAVFQAAETVKDGEIVPRPVREAGKFAVIWRRGSLPAKSRTLQQEEPSIRQLLERRRVDEARQAFLQKERAGKVRDEHPELLAQIPDALIGERKPRPRPELRPQRPKIGATPPQPTESGQR